MTSAITAPSSSGGISTEPERRNVSANGNAANAAESGFGSRARDAARKKSPEPRYSGTNHSSEREDPAADHEQPRARVGHISQSP